MRRYLAAATLTLALPLFPQSSTRTELARAEEDAEKVRKLVEAGALPRQALREAQLVLAEARDQDTLRLTLYGEVAAADLTEAQAESMMKAARGLVGRQQAELELAEKLVAEGALAQDQLTPYREELAIRLKTLAMAEERAALFNELVEMVRLEKELEIALAKSPEAVRKIAERFDGSGSFLSSQFRILKLEFQRRFRKSLPVSANGSTSLHRSMGFDHTGRVDVALHPDSPEGSWLKSLLERLNIPYFAFRGPVAGKSTGAHIHIGPPSGRIKRSN